jgi:DNA-binding transcriptional LysR family regulator
MNFAAVDLNLLRVFDAMMAERHTGRAGARVGLSQPAVSAAIGRLRHLTGDPLFLREGNRMVPTARAAELGLAVREALGRLERALADVGGFEAARSTRGFRLLGSDYFSTLLMPPLAALVGAEAPGVMLQMLDGGRGGPAAALADGFAELAVERAWEMPDWVVSEVLFVSHLVGVAARGNPVLAGVAPGAEPPPAAYRALRHALVSVDGGTRGTLDAELEAVGITRRVALTLPHFHAVALAVAESGLFAALPEHFARAVAPRLGLEIYRLPVGGPRMEVKMYWHARHDRDPASRWLRAKVRAAAAELAGEAAR